MIYGERDICRVRYMKYFQGQVTTLIGNPAVTINECSSLNDLSTFPSARAARVHYVFGLDFSAIDSSKVYLFLVEDSMTLVRLMKMVQGTVETYAGLAYGDVVNVDRLVAKFNDPKKCQFSKKVLYITDGTLKRLVRVSDLTGMTTVMATAIGG
eukprot:PhF_6_TR1139/c0_g1_i1/m.2321